MKKTSLAAAALALIALAGCSRGDEDQLNATEVNEVSQELNALSDDAANLAAEAQALENQASQLEQEAEATDGGPETPADENIAGM